MGAFSQILIALLVILVPAVLAVLRVIRGWRVVIAVYVVLAGLGALVGGASLGAELGLSYGALGLLLAFAFGRGGSVERIFLTAFVPFLVLTAVVSLAVWTQGGGDGGIEEMVLKEMGTKLDEFVEANRETGAFTETDLANQKARFESSIRPLLVVLPGMIAVFLAVVTLLNLLVTKDVLAVMNLGTGLTDLKGWKGPEWLIWPVIVLGFSVFLGRGTWLFGFAVNLLVISLIPFLFQGLAITSFFFHRLRMPKWLRTLMYTLGAMQLWILAVIPIGLFDVWIDFRKPKESKPDLDERSTKEDD